MPLDRFADIEPFQGAEGSDSGESTPGWPAAADSIAVADGLIGVRLLHADAGGARVGLIATTALLLADPDRRQSAGR